MLPAAQVSAFNGASEVPVPAAPELSTYQTISTTLKLTWADFPIDNALALYVDEHEGGIRLLLVQPAPTGTTDAMGFDRELILSFSEPISAEGVETIIVEELDTPG